MDNYFGQTMDHVFDSIIALKDEVCEYCHGEGYIEEEWTPDDHRTVPCLCQRGERMDEDDDS